MLDHLKDLFRYTDWAHRRWLDHLREALPAADRPRQLLAHIAVSETVWIRRLRGEDASDLDLWPDAAWEETARRLDDNHAAYADYLGGLSADDLRIPARYKNTKGHTYETPIGEVLLHVVTHGHYHRGQIAVAVREADAEPVNTDYITYVRNRPRATWD
ncbi:MAG: damage-inducible protein DinB [Bacteroidetes bacterium]|jgi:uncharacterized damage-inducible protein DinB|nr:damage-inducible protein DinB [Bacteroidota bacterium]